jgi:hypothetical protein
MPRITILRDYHYASILSASEEIKARESYLCNRAPEPSARTLNFPFSTIAREERINPLAASEHALCARVRPSFLVAAAPLFASRRIYQLNGEMCVCVPCSPDIYFKAYPCKV